MLIGKKGNKMDIEKTTTWIQMLADNWEVITGAALVVVAGIDKVALIFIRTLKNIKDSWRESFPKKTTWKQ